MKFQDFKDSDEFLNFAVNHLVEAQDEEFTIIKGHILIEYLLNYFISHSNEEVKWENVRLNFSQKLTLYEIFIKDRKKVDIIRKVNAMRNDIAHEMTVNANTLKEFQSISKQTSESNPLVKDHPTGKTIMAFSYLLGGLFATIQLYFDIEEEKNLLWKKSIDEQEDHKRLNRIQEKAKQL